MSPEQFAEYFSNPGMPDASSVASLEEIMREFPFCQPAQLAYLKSLQKSEDIRFNRQLKIAAAYAADRKVLFDLLQISETVAPGSEEATADEGRPAQPEPVIREEMQPVAGDRDKSGLLREIEQYVPITEMDLLLFDFPAYTDDGAPELPSQKRAPDFISPGEPTLIPDLSGGYSDQDLLRQFLETDPLSRQRKPEPVLRSMETGSPFSGTVSRTVRKTPADDLIDRFIDNPQSKVLRPDNAPVEEKDVSINSLREDDEFLTETLARIYVQQKYFLKAIQAYEKLSLKIPEKSVYFASQIEMVRELIKNQ